MSESQSREGIQAPPSTLWGILRQLGPGMILAGSIVGSGELIATTRTGAEAGFHFLWLIIIGCVIKVFTQIELARYTVANRKTTLSALRDLPGGVFIVYFWLIMFLVGLGQLGGIVGGVGQALAISWPITVEGKQYNAAVEETIQARLSQQLSVEDLDERRSKVAALKKNANDDKIYAVLVGVVAIIMLTWGKFRFIEIFTTTLVCGFTFVTIGNVFALQGVESYAIDFAAIKQGLSFGFPPAIGEQKPLFTALATFGIIGVGASELVAYPYWCLEKGYGKWIGPVEQTAEWESRAKGWMRVMKYDAWLSMVVYTVSTVAFYLLGAAILHRTGMIPASTEMVATLSSMYKPVFGAFAQQIFLVGAFAVLFSTFFVANAAKARMATDVIAVLGFATWTEQSRSKVVRIFGGLFPATCVIIYLFIPAPVTLVLIAGVMQSLLLPVLGFAALYFRYKACDPRLVPSPIWDIGLWISFACFAVIGSWLLYTKLF